MTTTELLIGILWVILGFWISYKRNWYEIFKGDDDDWTQFIVICIVVAAAPLCLIIAFVREMLLDNWNNN
jgi:hypothetical protein